MTDSHGAAPAPKEAHGSADKKKDGFSLWKAMRKYKLAIAAVVGLGGGYAAESNTAAVLGTAALVGAAGRADKRVQRYTDPVALGIAGLVVPAVDPNIYSGIAGAAGATAAGAVVGKRAHADLYGEDKEQNFTRLEEAAEEQAEIIDDESGKIALLTKHPDITWPTSTRGSAAEGSCDPSSPARIEAGRIQSELEPVLEEIVESPFWRATDEHEEKSEKKVRTLAMAVQGHLSGLIEDRGPALTVFKHLHALQQSMNALNAALKKATEEAEHLPHDEFGTQKEYKEEIKKRTEKRQSQYQKVMATSLAIAAGTGIMGVTKAVNNYERAKQEQIARLPEEIQALKTEKANLEAELKQIEGKEGMTKNKDGKDVTFERRRVELRAYIAQIAKDLKKKEEMLASSLGDGAKNVAPAPQNGDPDMNALPNMYEHPHFEFRATRKGNQVFVKFGPGLNNTNTRVEVLKPDSSIVHFNPLLKAKGDYFIADLPAELANEPSLEVACAVTESGGEVKVSKPVKLPKP